jgi:DNA-binding NtrC family response regulator
MKGLALNTKLTIGNNYPSTTYDIMAYFLLFKKINSDLLKGDIMDLFKKLRNMAVLLVDDDESIKDSLTAFFEIQGCYLLELATAEDAIKAIDQISFDVIISNHKLPGMNGLEFFRRTKKSIPKAMKILITTYGSDEMKSNALRCGIDDFIQKPLTAHALKKSLANLLEKREIHPWAEY